MKLIKKSRHFLIGCALVLSIAQTVNSQQPEKQRVERMEGYLATPQKLEFNEWRVT